MGFTRKTGKKIKNIHMRKTPYFLFVIYFLENFAKINIYLNSLNAQKKKKRELSKKFTLN